MSLQRSDAALCCLYVGQTKLSGALQTSLLSEVFACC